MTVFAISTSWIIAFLITCAIYTKLLGSISNSLNHRFVIKPGYAQGKGRLEYLNAEQLAELYELDADQYIVMPPNYTLQPTDIILPPLNTDEDYVNFRNEAVKWLYTRQAMYKENCA